MVYVPIDKIIDNTRDSIEISIEEYNSLIADRNALCALTEAGVDNWNGFSYAMSILNAEKEKE